MRRCFMAEALTFLGYALFSILILPIGSTGWYVDLCWSIPANLCIFSYWVLRR